MKKIIILLMITIIIILTTLCSSFNNAKDQISYTAYDEFITKLENMDFTIDSKDEETSILAGRRKWLTINKNDNITVYLYESNSKMEKDAGYLSTDGFSYDNGKETAAIDWISYPYFFKAENMIVLYVGENTEIIQALEELLGPKFAGDAK